MAPFDIYSVLITIVAAMTIKYLLLLEVIYCNIPEQSFSLVMAQSLFEIG